MPEQPQQQYTDQELAAFMRHKFPDTDKPDYSDSDLANFARTKYPEFAPLKSNDQPEGLGAIGGAIVNAVRQPLAAGLGAARSLSGYDASQAHVKAGQQDVASGNYAGAVAHGISAFPVVGPLIGQTAQDITHGNWWDATKGAAMLYFPELAGPALGLVSKGLGKVGEVVADATKATEGPLGVPLSAADTGGVIARAGQKVSSASVFGGKVWNDFRALQQTRLQQAANATVEGISAGASTRTGAEVGNMASTVMNAQFAEAQAPTRELFKQITGQDMVGTTPDQMLQEVNNAIKEYSKPSQTGDIIQQTSGKRVTVPTEGGSTSTSIDVRETPKGRTTATRTAESLKDDEGVTTTTYSGTKATTASTNPNFSKVDTLTKLRTQLQEDSVAFKKSVIDRTIATKPDSAYRLLTNPSVNEADLLDIKNKVGTDAWNAMRGRALADLIQDASQAEVKLPGTAKVVQPAKVGTGLQSVLQDSRTADRWKLLLGPSEYGKLTTLAQYGAAFNQPISKTTQYLQTIVKGIMLGGADVPAEAAAYGVARIMTRPEGMTLVTGLSKALGTNSAKDIAYYTSRLSALAARESTRVESASNKNQAASSTLTDKLIPPPLPQLQFAPTETSPLPFFQTPPRRVNQ